MRDDTNISADIRRAIMGPQSEPLPLAPAGDIGATIGDPCFGEREGDRPGSDL